jgi:uncharacterized protein (TIGR02444 family)
LWTELAGTWRRSSIWRSGFLWRGADPLDLFAHISELYAREGVAPLCLRLQDEHGFDVSLGLSALVDGMAGRAWSAEALAALRADGWDARAGLVIALRHARRLAKPLAAQDPVMGRLRAAILRQELAAERLAVDWLEARLGPVPADAMADRAIARDNLRLVAGEQTPQSLLDHLLDAALS